MKIKAKEGGWFHRFLTETTITEVDIYFAEMSRFTYEDCSQETHSNCARLTPLGVLNGLFGIELDVSSSLDSSTEDGPTPPA